MTEVRKNWAQEYIVDPLHEPEPHSTTGPGTSFRPEPSTSRVHTQYTGSSTTSATNPFRNGTSAAMKAGAKSRSRAVSDASAGSAGPSHARHSGEHHAPGPKQTSSHPDSSSPKVTTRHRRSSSLRERYPGDRSVHMLDQIRRDEKAAYRSPHLHKRHISGADTIDKLDAVPGAQYHHAGPYDAASLARNNSYTSSPIAALHITNAEALKATPFDKIKDSIADHRPLDGVAQYPPGTSDRFGQEYMYEEGTDMMREANPPGGAYKRYPGVDYLPDDLKGKGEPSYSMDKLMKEHKLSGRDKQAFELVDRPKHHSRGHAHSSSADAREDEGRRRSGSGGAKKLSGEIKRRVGSLKKKDIWV